MDPSNNGISLRWLIPCYLNKTFRMEDLSRIADELKLFHQVKSKLPESQRDILKYKHPGDLFDVLKPFMADEDRTPSGKALKRQEQEIAYSETAFLYEDGQIRIVSPLTEYASCWWGRGTRWCTAAEMDNKFEDYAEKSTVDYLGWKQTEISALDERY